MIIKNEEKPVWKVHLEIEFNELNEKIDELKWLLSHEKPDYISPIQWDLMHQQLDTMKSYAVILNLRLENS